MAQILEGSALFQSLGTMLAGTCTRVDVEVVLTVDSRSAPKR